MIYKEWKGSRMFHSLLILVVCIATNIMIYMELTTY